MPFLVNFEGGILTLEGRESKALPALIPSYRKLRCDVKRFGGPDTVCEAHPSDSLEFHFKYLKEYKNFL